MFKTLLISILISTQALAGLPPTSSKGQSEASPVTTFSIQTPYNQLTTTGSSTRLIETNNDDLLVNAKFEHSSVGTGWSAIVGTPAAETTNIHNGLKALKITLAAEDGVFAFQDVTPTIQMQGSALEHSIWAKTASSTIKVCARNAAATVGTCVNVLGDSVWHQYVINYPGPSSGSVGLSVMTTASTTGTVYLDDAYVGVARNIGTVQQSTQVADGYFATTASCTWSRTNTALGAFSTTSACPGPTVLTNQGPGTLQTTDFDLPKFTVNNLPAGLYEVQFFADVTGDNATMSTKCLAINDGTTTSTGNCGRTTNDSAISIVASATFNYTTSGNRSFELYGSAGANAIVVESQNSNRTLYFKINYFQSSAQTAVRADNYNTGWIPCTTGFAASWTANTTTACKMRRIDDVKEYNYNLALTGAPTSATLTLTLPTGDVIDTTKLAATTGVNQSLGYGSLVSAGAGFISFPTYASTTSLTVKYHGSTFSSVTQSAPNTFANGDSVNITARLPIVGLTNNQNAPLLVGSVTSNTSGLLRTEYAQVTVSNSAAAIVSQSGSWLSVANGAGAGLTTGTMTGFSGVPACSCTLVGAASTSASWCGWTAEPTTTNLSITRTRAGAAENGDINILCTGPR